MSNKKHEVPDCMFTNIEAASYCLLICNYGLRSNKLAEFPKGARIAMADVMENAHIAFTNFELSQYITKIDNSSDGGIYDEEPKQIKGFG